MAILALVRCMAQIMEGLAISPLCNSSHCAELSLQPSMSINELKSLIIFDLRLS